MDFRFDGDEIVSYADADLLPIDEEQGWAAALQIKRGGGQTETKKRQADERGLRAARMTLASYLRQKGYRDVDYAEAGVIDIYGQSGYARDLVIPKSGIDAFFGVTVTLAIDEVTAVMREALNAELNALLRPIISNFGKIESPTSSAAAGIEPTVRLRGRRAMLGIDVPAMPKAPRNRPN